MQVIAEMTCHRQITDAEAAAKPSGRCSYMI
jgi:hypothetical protein